MQRAQQLAVLLGSQCASFQEMITQWQMAFERERDASRDPTRLRPDILRLIDQLQLELATLFYELLSETERRECLHLSQDHQAAGSCSKTPPCSHADSLGKDGAMLCGLRSLSLRPRDPTRPVRSFSPHLPIQQTMPSSVHFTFILSDASCTFSLHQGTLLP